MQVATDFQELWYMPVFSWIILILNYLLLAG